MTQNDSTESALNLRLAAILKRQRTAFLLDGPPALDARRASLARLKNAILAYRHILETAIDRDFGHRPAAETAIMELMPTIRLIEYQRQNLRRWMRPQSRPTGLHLWPGRGEVRYQPLGVVGIIAPWNYPVGLCLGPLATALAAGNRAIIKPSELTPQTASVIAEMLAETFPAEEVTVVTGGPEVGAAFAGLPFDHLIFTGSTRVGRKVMKAASESLVPITLELGGKSPAIIDRGYPLKRAAGSIVFGKLTNAGQTCIAPDYLLIPQDLIGPFIEAFRGAAANAYPEGARDANYANIIAPPHLERLNRLVADAEAKSGRIVMIGGPSQRGTFVPCIIVGATPEMAIMQEEIFGPILPIVAAETVDAATQIVNEGPRPLSLYIFSERAATVNFILDHTTSGNVTVNDTMLHFAVDSLPFGGVGPSGMGSYHGPEGFVALSHSKGVFRQSKRNLAGLVRAPYGRAAERVLSLLLR